MAQVQVKTEGIGTGSFNVETLKLQNGSLARIILAVLLIAPVLALGLFVISLSVDQPAQDEWVMVSYFEKMAEGTLTLNDLFKFHNEHRIPFPKMVILGLGSLTKWNIAIEAYTGFLFLCATGLLFFWHWTRPNTKTRPLFFFLPVVLLLFSFRPWENLLWGFQVAVPMTLFGVVTALLFLENEGVFHFCGALAAALFATFSFAAGPLVWPAGAFFLFLQKRWRALGLWLGSGAVVMILYFQGFVQAVEAPKSLPEGLWRFFLGTGGSLTISESIIVKRIPLAIDFWLAAVGALLILTATIVGSVDAWKKAEGTSPVWCSIAAFGIGTAALVAYGRAEWGIASMFLPRYLSFTAFAAIGAYSVGLSSKRKWVHLLAVFLGVMILAASLSALYFGPQAGENFAAARWAQRKTMAAGFAPFDPNFSRQETKEFALTMARLKIGMYRSDY